MDVLLKQQFQFSVEDVRQNVLLPFDVPKAYDRISIRLRYAPKAVSDRAVIGPQIEACARTYFPAPYTLSETDLLEYRQLFNFVTLSLDGCGRYIGCAHRHDPEQHIVVGAAGSSEGFSPAAVTPGGWRAVLHVQAVIAGTIQYALEIDGLEAGETDADLPAF